MVRKLDRRQCLAMAASMGAAASVACAQSPGAAQEHDAAPLARIAPPTGLIPTAFLMDQGATMIDFAGPWEVFQDAMVAGVPGFRLYTVAANVDPFRTSPGDADYGGMMVTPDFTYETAPQPKVIVFGAQAGMRDPAKIEWVRRAAADADVVLSVCTGAFLLANTGLLDGLTATTHHDFYTAFEREFGSRVTLVRQRRFVENGKFVTAGGLTSGVDAALHVVARYHGEAVAAATATYMEHDSEGWRSGARTT